MAGRKRKLMTVLADVEATYNVAPALSPTTNAMVMRDVTLTPLGGEEVEDDENLPFMGHQGSALVGNYMQIEGSIPIAGSGTAGTAPAYSALLRSCGLAEVVTAGVKVDYTPVSTAFESLALWCNEDGALHKLSGGYSTVVLQWDAKKRPMFRFTTRGLYVPVTAQALPTIDRTKFKKALVASKINTPTLSLHGTPIVAQSLSIDLGNKVDKTDWVNDEEYDIDDRKITASIVSKAKDIAAKNWFDTAIAETLGAFAVTHGLVAGNIVEVTAANVQVGRPTEGDNNGLLTYTLPAMFTAQTAGSDIKLTVR